MKTGNKMKRVFLMVLAIALTMAPFQVAFAADLDEDLDILEVMEEVLDEEGEDLPEADAGEEVPGEDGPSEELEETGGAPETEDPEVEAKEDEEPQAEYTVMFTLPETQAILGDEEFDLLEGVAAEDEVGNALEVKVADDGGFDIAVVGEYTVTYQAVHPVTGEVYTQERLVAVEAEIAAMATTVVNNEAILRQAVANASNGDVIQISNNIVLTEQLNVDKSLTFRSVSGTVSITANQEQNLLYIPHNADITLTFSNVVLDGNSLARGIYSNANNLILKDVIIKNCFPKQSREGAAIYCLGSNLTITGNSKISDNKTNSVGGGVYIQAGTFTLEGGEISNNNAETGGAGVSAWHATVIIKGGKISNNTVNWGSGGGIDTRNCEEIYIYGGEISNNYAQSGGGLCVSQNNGNLTITGGKISNNSANSGGGVYIGHATIDISGNSEISGNVSKSSAGGFYISASTTTISGNAVISQNSSGSNGGGFYISSGTTTINGGRIINNQSSRDGGGIAAKLNTLEIRNNAIVANNIASQAYYITDVQDIALHNRQIDNSVTWTTGFDYIYNNMDVQYTKGSTTPPKTEFTIRVIEKYADSSRPDTTTPHIVTEGNPFNASFTIPTNYTASGTSTDSTAVINVNNATINIPTVTKNADIVITYTPIIKHTVTITEKFADASQPDVVTPHTVVDGDPFNTTFTIPTGYEASATTSGGSVVIDTATGAIDIASVTSDIDIIITYTPIVEHTVTVVSKYLDGTRPDDVKTYTVVDGGTFLETYDMAVGYQLMNYGLYSATFLVNPTNKTIYIDPVEQDYTVELEFDRIQYNVTLTTRYLDSAEPDNTQTFQVPHGDDFLGGYAILAGYQVVDYSPAGAVVDQSAQTVFVANVESNLDILLELDKIPHTVTVIGKYLDNSRPDDVKTYTVASGGTFYETYDMADGYRLMNYGLYSATFLVNPTNKTIFIDPVEQDYTVILEFDRLVYEVTLITRYRDNAEPERTESFQVVHGDAFQAGYTALTGYEVVDYSPATAVVDQTAKTVTLGNITANTTVELELDRSIYTVTIITRYMDGSEADNVETFQVTHGDPLTVPITVKLGYMILGTGGDSVGVSVSLANSSITINSVTSNRQTIVYLG